MGIELTLIEVSDGTVDLSPQERERAIKTALDFGFGMVSEVGKKDETCRWT